MKTRLSPQRSTAGGFALIIVLVFVTIIMVILGGTMNRTVSTALLNDRNNQTAVGIAAADAATEKVYSRMSADFVIGGVSRLSANLSSYASMYPGSDSSIESSYWTNFAFSDAQGNNNATFLNMSSSTNWTWWPNLGGQFPGLGGNVLTCRILSNVRVLNARYKVTNAVQQDVQLCQIPIFQFAIFYNSLLEFSTAATLTINGPVHANGNMYVGSSNPLTFNSVIGVTGAITNPAWAGSSSSWSGSVNYNGTVTTNTTSLVLPIGTNNSAAAVQQIVQPSPAGEAANSSMGLQRFYNKAQFNIIISNSSVTAWVKKVDPTSLTVLASNAVYWTNMNYFISTNNVANFMDQRESASQYEGLTQIDVGKYTTWGLTNAIVKTTLGTDGNGNGLVPNDIWIADYRTTNSITQDYGIRLTNGAAVPTNNYGLTLATPNALYVLGNYNVTNAGSGVNEIGTTNTAVSMPCSFICDALTILSSAWQDSQSSGSYSSRTPTDNTTINSAIVAGVVYSTGSGINQFSGGVHNLPRMLENWTGYNLWLNTSIVNLYNSQRSTGQFIYPGQSGTYYYPPTRHFSFDTRFTNPAYQPPGTPTLSTPRRAVWCTPPPGVTNYTGI